MSKSNHKFRKGDYDEDYQLEYQHKDKKRAKKEQKRRKYYDEYDSYEAHNRYNVKSQRFRI